MVAIRGGGALAVGRDGASAQRWDPATATWSPTTPLNADREFYAAVTLADGRTLVVGGVDTSEADHWRSYSSTYVYDPATPRGTWTKTGLSGPRALRRPPRSCRMGGCSSRVAPTSTARRGDP